MKIRNSFVSNSSSSSFVVFFRTKPKSIEGLQELLFGYDEWYMNPYGEHNFSAKIVTGTVFNEINNQKPNQIKDRH